MSDSNCNSSLRGRTYHPPQGTHTHLRIYRLSSGDLNSDDGTLSSEKSEKYEVQGRNEDVSDPNKGS